MKPRTRRILFSIALLAWSAVLLYFCASGRINKYLAADFRPFAYAGGIGLAVVGLFNLLMSGRETTAAHEHDIGGIHPLAAVLLMMMPVALASAWTRDEYSASALARKGLYDSPAAGAGLFPSAQVPALDLEEMQRSHQKNADGYYSFTLMDLFTAIGDPEQHASLDGLRVETEGRWIDEKVRNPLGTRKRLYRLLINCCAADGRAIPIVVDFGKMPPEIAENAWVKVSGTMRFFLEDGVQQAILVADRAGAAEPPPEEGFTRKK